MATETIVERCKKLWEGAVLYYQPFHERTERELAFTLKLRHWLADPYQTLDARRVKFRGRELFGKVRRKTADIMAAPLYIEALPVDDAQDQFTAEHAKWALEHDVRDPMKGFETFLERMVIGALAARKWGMAVDWDPSLGPFGDIVFRNVEPTRAFLEPPYQDTWDSRASWFIEETQMRVEDAQRMEGWKDTELLLADNAPMQKYGPLQQDSDEQGRVFLENTAVPDAGAMVKGTVTILKVWFRRDPDRKTVRRRKRDTMMALPPDQQYFGCTTCGYRTNPGEMPQSPLCPECMQQGQQSPLVNITHEVQEEEALAYPDGRLVICAPKCGVTLYDGPWPQKIRTFPYMMFGAYEHPRDAIGVSDTTLDQHVQIVSNALYRRAYDMAMSAPNVILMPGTAIKNAEGEQFQFTDEPWQIGFYDEPLSGQGIQHFQAPAAQPGLYQFINMIQQNFRADIGTAEVATGGQADELKSVPVGTVKAFVESGNVPTDHHIRRLRRELSIFFGVVHDIQRQMWTTARWVRMRGPDGLMAAQQLRGASLPGVDVQVTAEPEFKARTREELESIAAWVGQFGASEAMAELMGIPPTVANKIRAEQQQRQQEAMQQQMQAQQMAMGMPPQMAGAAQPGSGPGAMG